MDEITTELNSSDSGTGLYFGINNSRFCQDCPTYPEKLLCDVCHKIVCQYCSERAYWLLSRPPFYSLLSFENVGRNIHNYEIEYFEDVYFTCCYICEEKLFDCITENKLDLIERYKN